MKNKLNIWSLGDNRLMGIMKLDEKRSEYLTALKGLATIMVLIVHTGAGSLPDIFGEIGNDGARGVQLFFVISGILAFRSLDTFFRDRKITIKGILHWYLKKYYRLAPLYYLAIIVSMLTASWSPWWLGSEGHVTLKNMIAHIFLLHGLVPHYTDSVLYIEWYIGVLWIFYLLSPWIFWIINSFEKSVIFTIMVYLINPFLKARLATIFPVDQDSYIYNEFLSNFGPLNQILVFCFGIILYFAILRIQDKQYNNKSISSMLLILSLIWLFCLIDGGDCIFRLTRNEMFGLCFAILILSQAIHSSKIVCNPFFMLLGKYSYGIYLFQFFLLKHYDKYIRDNGYLEWFSRFVICLIAFTGIAVILDKLYEKPLNKIINNLIRNKKEYERKK